MSTVTTTRSKRRLRGVIPIRQATAVVVQSSNADGPGRLRDALREHDIRSTVIRLDEGEQLPDPESVKLAITLGVGADADRLALESKWLQDADAAGAHILGLGVGSAILASAFGGHVVAAPAAEHGWISVTSSDHDAVSAGPWFAWRDHTVKLPADATVLASRGDEPQAFRIRRHVGAQFHAQVTPELVSRWIARQGDAIVDAQGIGETAVREASAAAAATRGLVSGFLRTFAD